MEPITKVIQPRITRYSDTKFHCASESDERVHYVVRNLGHMWICQCPDYFERERTTCKHVAHIHTAMSDSTYIDKRSALILVTSAMTMLNDSIEELAGVVIDPLSDDAQILKNDMKLVYQKLELASIMMPAK